MKNYSIEEFIEKVSEKTPSPAGGSVMAVVSALMGSLSSMIIKFTENKVSDDSSIFDTHIKKLEKHIDELLICAENDADVYKEVKHAYAMPKNTEDEKAKRKDAINNALLNAQTPLVDMIYHTKEIGVSITSIMEIYYDKMEVFISDLYLISSLLSCILKSVINTMKINASYITDFNLFKSQYDEIDNLKNINLFNLTKLKNHAEMICENKLENAYDLLEEEEKCKKI